MKHKVPSRTIFFCLISLHTTCRHQGSRLKVEQPLMWRPFQFVVLAASAMHCVMQHELHAVLCLLRGI